MFFHQTNIEILSVFSARRQRSYRYCVVVVCLPLLIMILIIIIIKRRDNHNVYIRMTAALYTRAFSATLFLLQTVYDDMSANIFFFSFLFSSIFPFQFCFSVLLYILVPSFNHFCDKFIASDQYSRGFNFLND